ncbi:MAG: hypothetical protein HY000_03895 [Planctomycetes bacterium]|nr:hypothetical protein [Planctomycetota bacterium]
MPFSSARLKLEDEVWDERRQAWITVTFVVCNRQTCVRISPLEPKDLAIHLMRMAKDNPDQTPPMLHALPRRNNALGRVCGSPFLRSQRHRREWKDAVGLSRGQRGRCLGI